MIFSRSCQNFFKRTSGGCPLKMIKKRNMLVLKNQKGMEEWEKLVCRAYLGQLEEIERLATSPESPMDPLSRAYYGGGACNDERYEALLDVAFCVWNSKGSRDRMLRKAEERFKGGNAETFKRESAGLSGRILSKKWDDMKVGMTAGINQRGLLLKHGINHITEIKRLCNASSGFKELVAQFKAGENEEVLAEIIDELEKNLDPKLKGSGQEVADSLYLCARFVR